MEGLETKLGYFDLTELAETTVLGGVPAVEHDLYWQTITLGEIPDTSPVERAGSPCIFPKTGPGKISSMASCRSLPDAARGL